MLTQLRLKNERFQSSPFDFDIATFATAPFQIRELEGLGPVTADLGMSPYSNTDGEQITGAFVGKRNITFKLGINPNYPASETPATLRQEIYKYLMPKQKLTLSFSFSNIAYPCLIDGYVESVEPSIFSQTPEMLVSILCPMPYFTEDHEILVVGDSKNGGTNYFLDYTGTVPTGFTLRLFKDTGDANLSTNFTFYMKPDDSTDVSLKETFITQNISTLMVDSYRELYLNTRDGSKDFFKHDVSTGTVVDTRLFSKISNNSVWPKIYPGGNRHYLSVATPTQSYQIRYNNVYGGF